MTDSLHDTKGRKFGLKEIVSACLFCAVLLAVFLALKKPVRVAGRQPPAAVEANAASFQAKLNALTQPQQSGLVSAPDVHLTSDEISAAMVKSNAGPDVSQALAGGSAEDASIGEPLISFDGDVVKGQFASEVGGKRVYVTVAGHLGAKDGYATFDPTEFKVGDLSIPVTLVNGALQKKMAEQRDRLKLPDYIGDMKVENGELVVRTK